MLTYSADQLCALKRDDRPPLRRVRKAIFGLHLWFPRLRHPSRTKHGGGTRRYARDGGSGSSCNGLSFGLLNARSVSVTDRSTAISDVISSRHLDVLAFTETWHRAGTDVSLKRCAPTGYSIIDVPRPTRGGGVALLFDSRLTAKRLTFPVQPTTFEVVDCILSSASTAAAYIVIYRPGSPAAPALFFEELLALLQIVATYRCPTVISGDFNIHVNDLTDRCAQQFAEIIDSIDLMQAFSGPTHSDGNTLDLVITRRDSQPTDCDILPHDMITDHGLVVCHFESASFAVPRQIRHLRRWSKMDRAAFVATVCGH
jgi:Endonuclease-reverse transcriptase